MGVAHEPSQVHVSVGSTSEWRLLLLILTVAESFDPALLLESKMLGLRQSSEFAGGALDGKVEARIGPDEVHGLVVEEADASFL